MAKYSILNWLEEKLTNKMFSKKITVLRFSKILLFAFAIFLFICLKNKYVFSQTEKITSLIKKDTSAFILRLMQTKPEIFNSYIDSANKYEIQIIYTQINRNKNNHPTFTQYSFHLNDTLYFNPASLVKLPVLLLSLEKLNNLNIKKLNKYTQIKYDSVHSCQLKINTDSSAPNFKPCLAHYIRQILLASDNNAYNRLFEFLGQKYINEHLHSLGYNNACITQKFMGCTYEENRHTPPIQFCNHSGKIIYKQNMFYNPTEYCNPLKNVLKGKAYINSNDQLINTPKDFSYANNLPLQTVNDLFLYTIFPEAAPENKKLNLTHSDRKFLYQYFALYPIESDYDAYKDCSAFPDNYKKYFFFNRNQKHITDNNIRILNIVGQAWGWLADCAYIVDFKNKTEFMLTAVIYNVTDGIIDPTHYHTKEIGFPFLTELGQLFYNYELTRQREYLPDLKSLKKAINGRLR